jgi:hypothetical protein
MKQLLIKIRMIYVEFIVLPIKVIFRLYLTVNTIGYENQISSFCSIMPAYCLYTRLNQLDSHR